MKAITTLNDLIDDELCAAHDYAKQAAEFKIAMPELAALFVSLGEVEMGHVTKLHEAAAKIINEHKVKHGAPPAEMLAVYNYVHERQIKRATKIKGKLARAKT